MASNSLRIFFYAFSSKLTKVM